MTVCEISYIYFFLSFQLLSVSSTVHSKFRLQDTQFKTGRTFSETLLLPFNDNSRSVSAAFRFPRSKYFISWQYGVPLCIIKGYDVVNVRFLIISFLKVAVLTGPKLHEELVFVQLQMKIISIVLTTLLC